MPQVEPPNPSNYPFLALLKGPMETGGQSAIIPNIDKICSINRYSIITSHFETYF